MKKIAICDDEPAVRKQMEAYFKELESVFCISYFESGETLLESDVLYDVIFLDIDMKGISGIDTARKIRVRDKKAKIIYVTAWHWFNIFLRKIKKKKFWKSFRKLLTMNRRSKEVPGSVFIQTQGIRNFICRTFAILNIETEKSGL